MKRPDWPSSVVFEIIGEALNRAYKIDPEAIDSITDYRKII